MAKPRRGRRDFSKYISGAINQEIEMADPFAGKKFIGENVAQTVVDTTRVTTVRNTYSMNNFTPGADIGPFQVYVAHGNYTDAEVEEFIEQATSWDLGDMVAKEIRSRRIRLIGVFENPKAVAETARLNDGRPITTKLNWVLAEGDTVKFGLYNSGGIAATTTVINLHVFGKANLWQM